MARARFGQVYKGDGGAYCEGFADGLSDRLKESRRVEMATAKSTALVLVARRDDLIRYKQKRAKTWLSTECGIKLRSRHSAGASGSASAFSAGQADGRSTDTAKAARRKIC